MIDFERYRRLFGAYTEERSRNEPEMILLERPYPTSESAACDFDDWVYQARAFCPSEADETGYFPVYDVAWDHDRYGMIKGYDSPIYSMYTGFWMNPNTGAVV